MFLARRNKFLKEKEKVVLRKIKILAVWHIPYYLW
jgi:hypothetical protein